MKNPLYNGARAMVPTEEINVLDHGFVRLVDWMGNDLSVIRSARVSYNAAWRKGGDGDDLKLLRRLWSGRPSTYTGPLPENPKHSTPFEAVTMTFEVFAPIFVFRQWHRHRTQSYNELSARYRELPEVYYVPSAEVVGTQSVDNKQGRVVDEAMIPVRERELEAYDEHCRKSFILYRSLLASGWPKELARGVLPFVTYSHMFTTMSLLNFFRFATLRADSHAQHEIQVYARAMLDLVDKYVATGSVALFREANSNG